MFARESQYGVNLPGAESVVYSEDVTTKERIDTLETRVSDVESRIDTPVGPQPRFGPLGLRAGVWIRKNKLATVSLTVAVLTLAGTYAEFIYPAHIEHTEEDLANKIDNHIDAKLKDPLKQLNDIAVQIGEIRGRLAAQEIRNHASLSKREFESRLPELKSAVQIATRQNIKVPQTVATTLSGKLQQVGSNAPDFWPTVSVFITYRSSLTVEGIRKWQSLPACRPAPTSLANATAQVVSPGGKPLGPKAAIVHVGLFDCAVTLDNMEAEHITYSRCLVKYSGGPIKRLTDVTFKDCVFEFSVSAPPPPPGQHLGEVLLASNDLSSVHVP